MDVTSQRWFQLDAREIINPHVLKASWPKGAVWTDEHNHAISLHNGARVTRALMRRCSQHLIVAAANIDSQGFEQDGLLLEALYAGLEGEEGKGDAVSTRTKRSS
jgi:hypothetical protein